MLSKSRLYRLFDDDIWDLETSLKAAEDAVNQPATREGALQLKAALSDLAAEVRRIISDDLIDEGYSPKFPELWEDVDGGQTAH